MKPERKRFLTLIGELDGRSGMLLVDAYKDNCTIAVGLFVCQLHTNRPINSQSITCFHKTPAKLSIKIIIITDCAQEYTRLNKFFCDAMCKICRTIDIILHNL